MRDERLDLPAMRSELSRHFGLRFSSRLLPRQRVRHRLSRVRQRVPLEKATQSAHGPSLGQKVHVSGKSDKLEFRMSLMFNYSLDDATTGRVIWQISSIDKYKSYFSKPLKSRLKHISASYFCLNNARARVYVIEAKLKLQFKWPEIINI